ncbi:hypothetical protein DPMN_139711 [Dreissena polymorpha]|uniref:Uncharacterized protein n=1 Tax=Dreissena polymorpha TaxID=45954 RepID=A0A9D4G9H8_DREPO|nr:hypothetical protein DPMN_139711 [Dreissena polymorpha]
MQRLPIRELSLEAVKRELLTEREEKEKLRQQVIDLQNKEKNLEQEIALKTAQLLEEKNAIEEDLKSCKHALEDYRRKYQCIMEPLRACYPDPEGEVDKLMNLVQIPLFLSRNKSDESA